MSLVQYILWYELWTLSHFDGMKYKHWRWFHLWVWVMEVDDRIRYELWRLSVWIVKLDDGMNYEWTPIFICCQRLNPDAGQSVEKRELKCVIAKGKRRWEEKVQYLPYSQHSYRMVVQVFNPALQKKGVKAAPWDPDINWQDWQEREDRTRPWY